MRRRKYVKRRGRGRGGYKKRGRARRVRTKIGSRGGIRL